MLVFVLASSSGDDTPVFALERTRWGWSPVASSFPLGSGGYLFFCPEVPNSLGTILPETARLLCESSRRTQLSAFLWVLPDKRAQKGPQLRISLLPLRSVRLPWTRGKSSMCCGLSGQLETPAEGLDIYSASTRLLNMCSPLSPGLSAESMGVPCTWEDWMRE